MQFTVPLISFLGAVVLCFSAAPFSSGEVHNGPVKYLFQYTVHDEHTGDIKSQQEERHGDNVVGQYTLIDSDGYRRIVDYSSDKHTGFVANVHRAPLKNHVVPAVKVIESVPVLKLAKSIKLAPAVYTLKPVHHVALSVPQYTQLHREVLQATHVKPVVYRKKSPDSHSHTSFKSGNVSYQY